jgi:hypothetical protein
MPAVSISFSWATSPVTVTFYAISPHILATLYYRALYCRVNCHRNSSHPSPKPLPENTAAIVPFTFGI